MEKQPSGIAFVFYPADDEDSREEHRLFFDYTREEAETTVTDNHHMGLRCELVAFVELDQSSYAFDILKGLWGAEEERWQWAHKNTIEDLFNKIFEAGIAEGKRRMSRA